MNRGRKISGGKYHKLRKKKHHTKNGQEKIVLLKDEVKNKIIKVRGGNKKAILLSTNYVNLSANGKIERIEIKNVSETPQNIFLARQNRLMKGAIIETSSGKAKITNRPSKEGHINAVLIAEKKN